MRFSSLPLLLLLSAVEAFLLRRRYQCYQKAHIVLQAEQQSQAASIAGVSVSEEGFWTIFSTDDDNSYVPIQVTDTTEDATAATSPQALTILQLLANVDMAGTILPPERLALIVVDCEQGSDSSTPVQKDVTDAVQASVASVLSKVTKGAPSSTLHLSRKRLQFHGTAMGACE